MFEDISKKFKKLKMPEDSLIKKIGRIKNNPDPGKEQTDQHGSTSSNIDISDQIKKAEEELILKIDGLVKSKTEQINSSIESMKEFEVKLTKLEGGFSITKNTVGEFKDRLDKIDESLLELLSLYEVVSSTVNPFVGDKTNVPNDKLEQIEKKIEALSQRKPELPSSLTEQYDIKFKALEGSMEELTSMMASSSMNSSPINQEDITKNVSERVLEQIAPLLEQKFHEAETQNIQPSNTAPETVKIQSAKAYCSDENAKLTSLDNRAETSIILLNWLEFLLEKVGRNNLGEVLEYYIEIGWISECVCDKMIAYANGIDYYVERPTWKLLTDDHMRSLMFIEQLKGKKLDRTLLSRLERDAEKVTRVNEVHIS